MTEQRRLAAILVADVVGYSKLVSADEAGTLKRLRALRADVIDPLVGRHSGRLFKTMGDGFLVEFASAVQAVSCAKAIQDANRESGLHLRIGIHLGDVVVQGDDLMGDGVNIAARVEGVAEPGGIAITRAVHEQVRDKLDMKFVDKGQVELKNLVRPVRVFAFGGPTGSGASPLALPDKPSIAVLPFQNMSGDPEQEYFADGIVEDIITALSRFKALFVIARTSSFTFKGKTVDIKQVGRELGVRYVLEGSVRKAGGRVRITGQLIDSQSGAHVWADRFEGALAEIFDLQDQVTTSVVGAIIPAVNRAEGERARRTPVENLDAYDCYLRGFTTFRQFTQQACTEALRLYYRAIELAPNFASPYGAATHFYASSKLQGWDFDAEQAEAEVRRLAERVSALGQDDAAALSSAGFSLAWVCREYDMGASFVDKAVVANPNLSGAWMQRGAVSGFRGQHEAALEDFSRARRISPVGAEFHLIQGYCALSYLSLDQYEAAATAALDAATHLPNWLVGPLLLTAAHGFLGNVEDAQKGLAQLRRLRPKLTLSEAMNTFTYRRAEDTKRLVEGLRRAGLPV
jgi:adenylate cyclase